FALPKGSRIMQTGGFKGRSRSVDSAAMLQLLQTRYGVPASLIISEYSMTELSSQFYENSSADSFDCNSNQQRFYRVPPWVRIAAADPISFQQLPETQLGLLRIEDLANLDSCFALQTQDVVRIAGQGFQLLGRAQHATLRGCSWGADQNLD